MKPTRIDNLTVGERDPLKRRQMEFYRNGTRVVRIQNLQHFTTAMLWQRSANNASEKQEWRRK